MKCSLRAASLLAALFAVVLVVGCQVQPGANVNQGQPPPQQQQGVATPAQTATPPATAAATPDRAGGGRVPVTLPVLDAMFADEGFAGELKSKLQLTDEQVENLRRTAREAVGNLREIDAAADESYGGTTSAAAARAEDQIKGVIGADKWPQLAAFVRERWSGGGAEGNGAAALTAKPSSVPTDTRVVVNAPAYRMDVFENGTLVKTYRVGIGYPEFPLPTGLRRADTIIFNPTWTPPDEPWVESPSNKVKAGEKIDAGSPLNPLGLIKIPIGLPSLIHGGKSPAKLGTFASHGCVGLTNPQVQDFAVMLAKIGGAELTAADAKAYAKERTETKNVKLNNAVPVELRYETIVVEDGKLYVYRDVYDYGTNTEENLRAVLEANGVSFEQLSEPERAQALDALKQMARDAQGRPADGGGSANNSNGNENTSNKNAKRADATSERVTRSVKGRKEIVVEIAALKGKGYPASVNLVNASGQSSGGKRSDAATTRKRT
ncbi:MAG: L,D-transpeptidase [Pyrinomonadaceae bacterium]